MKLTFLFINVTYVSNSSCAEVKNEWRYTSASLIPSWRGEKQLYLHLFLPYGYKCS